MPKKLIRISDHACLRYAERVLGFDRAQVRADLERLIGGATEICPNCRVPFSVGGEDYVAVVENRTVLTILPRHEVVPRKTKRPKLFRATKGPADLFERLSHSSSGE